MASLYDELLANIGKTASVDNVKQGIQNFSSDELIRLAEDLATISKDKDLAEMAKLLPVYSANQRTDDQIETEQIIHGIDSSDAYTADADKDNMVLASYEEIKDKIKSKVSARMEDDIEDVVEDAVDDAVDEAVDAATDEGVEVSASETLYALLKEGAAFEDMIETRAAEMAYEIIKQAEDYEVAREIVEEASEVLTDNPAKAHEYSEQMMEKVRTVAATNDIPMSDAAAAVTSKVIGAAEDNGLIEGDEGEDMEDIVDAIQARAYEDAYNDLYKQASPADVGSVAKAVWSKGRPKKSPQRYLSKSPAREKAIQADTRKKVGIASGAAAVGAGTAGFAVGRATGNKNTRTLTPNDINAIYANAYEEAYDSIMKEAGVLSGIKGVAQGAKSYVGTHINAAKGIMPTGYSLSPAQQAALVRDARKRLAVAGVGTAGALGAGGYAVNKLVGGNDIEDLTPDELAALDVIYANAYEEAYTGLQKKASTYNYFDGMSKYASELEYAYEKLAEEVMDAAESLVRQHGEQMGLNSSELYEYVRVSMDDIKTLAAKRDMNLAEAAQAYLTGDTGSEVGIVEETFPSPSEAPSVFKAPINSNQTQRPDEYIPQMAAPADPDVAAMIGEGEKEAYLQEYVKQLVKEAMYEIVEENY